MTRPRDVDLHLCVICSEPVELTKARSDGDGRPVHEECFAAKVHREFAARPVKPEGDGATSWRPIAEQITHETDPKRMIQLTEKLNEALVEEEKQKADRRKQAGSK